jgi:hypothetical protein
MRLLLVALVVALGTATLGSAATSRVIRGDEWISSFAVKKNGKLGGAVGAFGAPSSTKRGDGTCLVRWSSLGVTITFYNLGGQDACGRSTGFFRSATISGRGWRTSQGLAIGNSLARVRALFPKAERHGTRWWLVSRFTQATGRYPGLSASVHGGKVADFQVIFGAGGE